MTEKTRSYSVKVTDVATGEDVIMIAGAACLYVIASGKAGFDLSGGFASNGYGEHSPGGYSLGAGVVFEVLMSLRVRVRHSWLDFAISSSTSVASTWSASPVFKRSMNS
jgi:hypothetical protein